MCEIHRSVVCEEISLSNDLAAVIPLALTPQVSQKHDHEVHEGASLLAWLAISGYLKKESRHSA